MSSTLFVFFNTETVGKITLNEKRQWSFQYEATWLQRENAFALSVRLPLQADPFENDFAKVFFANLLPEGEVRRLIAAKYKISMSNDFEMLAAIGGDCAGAISVYPESIPLPKKRIYRELLASELDNLISEMPRRPLIIADGKARLSLAGAQDKLPVYYEDEKIFLPEQGAISSHILKTPIPHFADTVVNEAFCMKLARAAGLQVPESEIIFCKQTPLYLVKRYDRSGDSRSTIQRLHQEDFCQALEKYPEQKYQNEGGPRFADCFALLEKESLQPALDKKALITWAIFNFFIGNCDAHAKNISLLISAAGTQLAPFYDLMSTQIYEDLSGKLAMKIGNKYDPSRVFERHWETFAEEAGVKFRIVLEILKDFSADLPKLAEAESESFIKNFGGEKTLGKLLKLIQDKAKRFV